MAPWPVRAAKPAGQVVRGASVMVVLMVVPSLLCDSDGGWWFSAGAGAEQLAGVLGALALGVGAGEPSPAAPDGAQQRARVVGGVQGDRPVIRPAAPSRELHARGRVGSVDLDAAALVRQAPVGSHGWRRPVGRVIPPRSPAS